MESVARSEQSHTSESHWSQAGKFAFIHLKYAAAQLRLHIVGVAAMICVAPSDDGTVLLRLMPRFSGFNRPSHEGLLKVEKRVFRCLGV